VDLTKLGAKSPYEKLHVDITFETGMSGFAGKCHPVMCADLISFRCKELSYLKPITILLKKLLRNSGLNNPYFGTIQGFYTE